MVIKGVPEATYAERASDARQGVDDLPVSDGHQRATETAVIDLCRDLLKINVTPQDISIAHRIKASPKDTVRPIIVRFANKRVRDDIYNARKLLKNRSSPVYISEHLTKSTSELFFEARKLIREKKIVSAWTKNGIVMIKFTSDTSERPTVVKSRQDLNPRTP